MRIFLKLTLVIIGLIGLSNGAAPIPYNNGLTGSKKIQLKSTNFGFCNVGTIDDTNGQVFNMNFDESFSQLPFNLKSYFNTTLDPMVPLPNNANANNIKFDSIIQSVIYESINEAGYMYSGGSQECAVALSNYMCSVTFPRYSSSVTEKPCSSLCTDIDTACGSGNSFVFDFVNSFNQVFPDSTECSAMGSTDCSSTSGNSLENWEGGLQKAAVLFYLYPEDYPMCSYTSNVKEGYRYLYPLDNYIFPTPFDIAANYTQASDRFGAYVSNLNNKGSVCSNCVNCTSTTCDVCYQCKNNLIGKQGDACSDCTVTKDSNGNDVWSCPTCSGSRGSFQLDSSIREALFAGSNEDGFEYVEDATEDCVEILLTYLCTYTFRERGYEPCNSVCNATRASIYKCPSSFEYTFDKPYEILPNVALCESQGVPDSEGCSAVSFLKFGNPFGWKNLYGTNIYFQLRPGGAVKGSVLGFGVLLGLLLVIASLGLIMKQQSKK